MPRNDPNIKEGTLNHKGTMYPQPTSDEQFVTIVELGNLLSVDPLYEVWVLHGMVAILPNDVLGVLE